MEKKRNLWVIPTNKSSRVYTVNSIGKLDWSEGYLHQVDGGQNQNIYITSDEEIKEGDWCHTFHPCTKDENRIFKTEKLMFGIQNNFHPYWRKIILTTDQDLNKDGVQSIPDEFLEWFVKNPSCEEVKVIKTFEDYTIVGGKPDEIYYKIIIPKEEPISYEDFREKASKQLLEKFDNEASKGSGDGDFDNYFYGNCKYWERKLKEESKQETLEEAKQRYAELCYVYPLEKAKTFDKEAQIELLKRQFELGAKWQIENILELLKSNEYDDEPVFDLISNHLKL